MKKVGFIIFAVKSLDFSQVWICEKIKTFGFSHNADYGETPLTLSNKILKTLFCISFSAFEIFINLTNAKSAV